MRPAAILLLALFGPSLLAQEVEPPGPSDRIRIAFYNVENLFDTEDDPLKNDNEFLPEGTNRWTKYRYEVKLNHIAKVLINLGGWEMPAVVGLCEVENRQVLEDLVRKTGLENFDYEIVHEDAPDARGIDVALLYRPDIFRYIKHDIVRITFPFDRDVLTRDILHVEGTLAGDTVHVFVNHWPSRRGGQEVSEPRRVYVAQQLRKRVDSLFALNANARILIIGDLNDGPEDKSVAETLQAVGQMEEMKTPGLIDAMYQLKFKKGLGTHKYRGEWNTLDHIVLSTALLDTSNNLYCLSSDVIIHESPWLMEDDPQNPGQKPWRTYAGPNYLGGYSDHLPVYVDLRVKPRW